MDLQPGDSRKTEGAARPKASMRIVAFAIFLILAVGLYSAWKVFTWTQPWRALSQMPVNLTEFLNNDGASWEKNRRDTNFDCPDHASDVPGSGYPAENLPASAEVFSCKVLPGVYFIFPPTNDGAKNNVACAGQRIEFPPVRAEKLYILGGAENGPREEEVKLSYEDGEDSVPLRFSDWCEPAQFNELQGFRFDRRFAWDIKVQEMVEEKVQCRIWVQELRVDPTKRLKRIQLPYNERIHIFAMTLAVRRGEIAHLRYSQETARIYKEMIEGNAPTFAALHERQQSLRDRLKQIEVEQGGRRQRECRWVETTLRLIDSMIPGPPFRGARSSIKTIHELQDDAETDIRELEAGRNPFPEKRGAILKGTWSEIDGSIQPYWVAVPKEYKGDKEFPLIVSLHGHGGWGVFQGRIYGGAADAITLSPHGRGSIDYFFIAEEAVLAAIREVQQDYRIDLNRVYMTGGSMGGTGSWALGVRFPDIFAAIVPNSGNADHKVWIQTWGWDWGWGRGAGASAGGSPLDPIGQFARDVFGPKQEAPTTKSFQSLGEFISDEIDPVTYAENLINLPAYAGHGAEDEVVPVGHARSMSARLHDLGYNALYDEDPKAGHSVPGDIRKKQQEWMVKQKRNTRPKVVRYRTNKLRYPGANWLAINKFLRRCSFSEIEGKVGDEGAIDIRTSNVANFSIDLRDCPAPGEIDVSIDGAAAFTGRQPKSKQLTFEKRADGKWVQAERPVGVGKRATVEGPIEDLFMSPFMVVYGTSANTDMERDIIKAEAETFAKDWDRLFHSAVRMKPDADVTHEDIDNYNLILYGRPTANLITARVADRMPIRFDEKRITFGKDAFGGDDLGVKFCCPNPLNPNRCVAVFAATTWQGMIDINTRFGNWFMWGVYDNRNWFDYGIFDDRTRSPDTFLVVGFFDDNWKRCAETEWRGDADARAKSLPRTIPKFKEPPPDATEMALTDLMPTKIEQHKGAVSFDRSFHGHALSIGKKTYKRGLGVRPHATTQSSVEFNIAGRFDRFRVEAGACLEGKDRFPAARKRNESLQFIVYGDGRQLYKTDWIKCDAPRQVIDVEVTNVKKLTLKCVGGGASWHCGSCTWGDPKLTKEPTS